jgi:outer membrane protein OmpA-like peptidoglycan-associated protein
MKRSAAIALFLICSTLAFSQERIVTISGTVRCTIDSELVKEAKVFLKLSDGTNYMHVTDSTGNYKFSLFTDTSITFILSIGTDKQTTSKTFVFGFLASKDRILGNLRTSNHYLKNFNLTPVTGGGEVSLRVLFNTNSILSCNDSLNRFDSTRYKTFEAECNLLYSILKKEPTVTIELQGHASTLEKNHELLSLYRAQLIKEVLVAKGINRNRIAAKGWGNHKLLVRDETIKKAKTEEEKNALHLKNQRVVFRITGWDFKE